MKKHRLAFVTGGSRGIGRAIALKLMENNFDVCLGYKNNRKLAENTVKGKDNALAVQVDIADRKSIRSAITRCVEHFKKDIGILINNAGMAQEKPFLEITDDDWDKMLTTNLRGAFSTSQEVIPGMIGQNFGRIINISSIGGQWGGFNQVHYAASKAGLNNLTRSLAKLYSKDGILTNTVAIGLAQTDMSGPEIASDAGQEKIEGIPIGRIASVEEIADVVVFLCSDDASYLTGQTINLNGGMYFG